MEAELATTVSIDHWSGAIGEIGGNCCKGALKPRGCENSVVPQLLDGAAWVAGAGRRPLRCEQGGLRLAVYKGDYNSTRMAKLQPTPPKVSHLPPFPFYYCQTPVFAWNLPGCGIFSRTKRSLCGILSIFIATQALSRSLPPHLPPILAAQPQRVPKFILSNPSGIPFLPDCR